MRQPQEDSCRRLTVSGLKDHLSRGPEQEVRVGFLGVIPCDDCHSLFGGDDPVGAVQRMLKHRPATNEGAVLLRFVAPQPALDQRSESLTVASGQDKRPDIPKRPTRVHLALLFKKREVLSSRC